MEDIQTQIESNNSCSDQFAAYEAYRWIEPFNSYKISDLFFRDLMDKLVQSF